MIKIVLVLDFFIGDEAVEKPQYSTKVCIFWKNLNHFLKDLLFSLKVVPKRKILLDRRTE
jgi:hypothetical protein